MRFKLWFVVLALGLTSVLLWGATPAIPAKAADQQEITVDRITIARDAVTGELKYDFSATFRDSHGCPFTDFYCSVSMEGRYANGEWDDFATSYPFQSEHTWPFVWARTGAVDFGRITAVRASLMYRGGAVSYSESYPVTDAPLSTSSVTLNTFQRSASELSVDADLTAADFHEIDDACPYYSVKYGNITACELRLYGGSDDQSVSPVLLGVAGALERAPSPATLHVSTAAPVAAPKLNWLRVDIRYRDSSSNWHTASTGSQVRVRDPGPTDFRGGGNPSQKACPCAAKDPIDTLTGEFSLPAVDLTLAGAGPFVGIGRTYSVLGAGADGPFGFGWASGFTARLNVVTPGDVGDPLPRRVEIVQENGSTTGFAEGADHSYSADAWVTATLARDASTDQWTFTRDHRQRLTFDASGRLVAMSDQHGVTVGYGYAGSGQVNQISGSGSRTVSLTWTAGRVSAVADGSGRSVSYTYDAAGNLTAVKGVDGTRWAYVYDSGHRMTSLTRPGGGVTSNVYDGAGRVTQQTDPLNRTSTFTYGVASTTITEPDGTKEIYEYNQGAIARITRAAGTAVQQVWSYGYDSALNQVVAVDPLGNRTTSTFDASGDPLTTTDPLGRVTTRTFDPLRDVTSVTDPAGRTMSMTYNTAGDLLSTTTPGSHTTSFAYNPDGTPSSSTDPAGKVTSVTYNAAGLPLCTTDPDSRKRCVAYNSAGFVTSSTDAAGKVSTLTVEAAGRVLTSKDPLNRTTSFAYDADGNRTKVTDPLNRAMSSAFDVADQLTSTTDAATKTTTYGYDSRGRPTTVTDPLGHKVTTAYDALDRKIGVTDALGRTTGYSYDGADRPLAVTLPSGGVSSSSYDAAGQLTSSTDALGKVTAYTYDLAGRLSSTKDPLGRVTSQSYTPDGQVDTITLPNAATVKSTWDAVGRPLTHVNADGKTTSYTYDAAGLVTKKVEPGALTTGFVYDAAGRVASTTRPDGTVVASTYDAAGQLTKADYPGTADDVTYTYKADGARATMVDRTGTTSYTYGTTGMTTKVVNGAGAALSYGYDAASRLTSITYPGSKQVAYVYDNADQMTKVTDWASRATAFTWTPDGVLATQTSPNGVVDTRTYDAADQLTQIADKKGTTSVAAFGYGYDAAGQLTSATVNGATRTYGYDQLGQLGTTSAGTYAASSAGLLTRLANGATQSFNAAQQLTTQTPVSGPATSFGYDGNGSRTTSTVAANGSVPAQTTMYGYDSSGDLASATVSGGTAVSYASDGDGVRQSRTSGGSTAKLLWGTVSALPLLLDDGTTSFVYGPSGTPVEQVTTVSGAVSFLHADNLGSVRAVTDATGAVVGTADYDAFGRRSTTGTVTAIGYTGNLTDPGTGMLYLRARDYDPATGQFLQVDPAVDLTRQPYAYTGNAPLNTTDPTGLCAFAGDNPSACFVLGLVESQSPALHTVASYIECLDSYDGYTCAVMNLDPVYAVLDGYGSEITDAQNGCSGWQIAADGAEGTMGLVGTAAIAGGGVGLSRSGIGNRIGDRWQLFKDYARANPDRGSIGGNPAPSDYKLISTSEAKRILKQYDTNPHDFKEEFVNEISSFDLRIAKSGEIVLATKDGKIVVPTGYYR